MSFSRPSTARFTVLEFFFWGAIMAVEGFMVPYLVGMGFTERQAGLVMAAIYLVSVGSTPMWGYIADRSGRHLRIVALSMGVSIAAVLAIRVSGRSFALVVVFALLYSLTGISLPSLIDSWIMRLRRKGFTISYEIARGFGSFGYAATGAILGLVLERFGLHLLFPVFAGIALVVIIVTVTTRDSAGPAVPPDTIARDRAEDAREAAARSLPNAARAVVSNGRYVILVLSIFVLFIGTRAAITFLPLRIYELGGTTEHVGWAQSVSAAFEIPFMFLSAVLLRRIRPRAVILGAMSIFVLRLALNVVASSPWTLVGVQLLKGPSFGFLLPATVHYIDKIAPREFRSLFQTLAPAIYFGLASTIGSAVGGAVVERFGLMTLYVGSPVIGAIAVAMFGVFVLNRRRLERLEAGAR